MKAMKKSCSLIDLIQCINETNWERIEHCLSKVKFEERNNAFALHEICSDPTNPMKIVKSIYHAYPKAALTRNDEKHTPILIAVEAEFEDAVEFLANACPEASAIYDGINSTPLHSAVYSLTSSNMIDFIVSTNPSTVLIPDEKSESALDVFFHEWNGYIRVLAQKIISNPTRTDEILDYYIGNGDWKAREIYQKGCLLLKAAHACKNGESLSESNLLHCAFMEKSCHWAFCRLLMELHPEQVLARDSDGNLPIHTIAAAKEKSDRDTFFCIDCCNDDSKLVSIQFLNGYFKYCCEECFESEPRDSISESYVMSPVNKVHETIKNIMDIAPNTASIPDNRGNYPLFIAIQNQQSYDTINEIFKAFPEVIETKDIVTNSLPFVLAAGGNWENEIEQVTAIYFLLRQDPNSVLNI